MLFFFKDNILKRKSINKIILKSYIKDLINITNLSNLISKRIIIKKKGKYFVGLCPFHEEKTPSFTINDEIRFYYCFGCNVHGNAIDFLINYEKISFIESIEELSSINGLKVIYNNTKYNIIKKPNKFDLYDLLEKISFFYQKNLFGINGINSLKYLKKRGLSEKIIKKFLIGFSLNKKNDILNNFGNNEEKKKKLYDTGMIIFNNGKIYDRFINRIIFPIFNIKNKIIGFGGRALNNKLPKYLNSPITEIFNKSKNLYGLNNLIKYKKVLKYILIVEGYLDVITLKQFGFNFVVSSLGTFITSYQINLLFNNTKTIIFCYDGDLSGLKASWNSLNTCLPYMKDGREIKFIFLPNNEDPDTLIRKEGKNKFKERINSAKSFSDFLFEKLLFKLNLNNINDRVKLSILALPIITKIPGDFLRLNLRKLLSIKLKLINDVELENWIKTKKNFFNFNEKYKIKKTNIINMISLLIQNPKLSTIIPSFKKLIIYKEIYPGLSLFLNLLNIISLTPNINTGQLIEYYRNDKLIKFIKILSIININLSYKKSKILFLNNFIIFLNLLIKQKIKNLVFNLNFKNKEEIILLNKILYNSFFFLKN